MLDKVLQNVAVIGAAGKMGSGIALLLCQEMARTEAEKTGKVGSGEYKLTLIDVNELSLYALRKNLRTHLTKYAEKNINELRSYFAQDPKLISNEDIIRAFVEGANDIINLQTEIASAKKATLIFEAIHENLSSKSMCFSTLAATRQTEQYYFSNTSSIPISLINDTCHLQNRIVGFHFYNPPAVQRLVEIIAPSSTEPKLLTIADELGKRLNKTLIYSRDVAGFIGNGHFIREVIFACKQVKELMQTKGLSSSKAIYLINRITQDYLLRPMGIFQLVDYVGIDICQNIAKVMSAYLPDSSLQDDLIDNMVASGIVGGQFPDGSQKNGFFQYEHLAIKGVFSLDDKKYHALTEGSHQIEVDALLNKWPHEPLSWKSLQADHDKKSKIDKFLQNLFDSNTLATNLAKDFAVNSKKIVQQLVHNGIAENSEDVDTVLKNGFFHLYGIGSLKVPQEVMVKKHV